MSSMSTSELFEKLERSLLSLVASGDTTDYERLTQYLAFAQEIHNLSERFRRISAPKEMGAHSSEHKPDNAAHRHAKKTPEPSSKINPGEPVYFIHGSSLVKMGISSSEAGGLYKKTVPLAAVELICDGIEQQLTKLSHISSSDLQNVLSMPSYKVQITIMALVAAGAIRQIGRGKYSTEGVLRTIPTKHKLLETLQALPKHNDLLDQYANQG